MTVITTDFAKLFAQQWVSSWNSHNIDDILSHYADDFTIESPMASKLVPASNGRIVGRNAVKEYWTTGLSRNQNLEFHILDVLIGINGLTIYYVNRGTKLRSVEIMVFNQEGKVQKAFVHYAE